MGTMTDPRIVFARTELKFDVGQEATLELSSEPWRYEHPVVVWVGIILLLVLMLIMALSEDVETGLVGWFQGSAGHFEEPPGKAPRPSGALGCGRAAELAACGSPQGCREISQPL